MIMMTICMLAKRARGALWGLLLLGATAQAQVIKPVADITPIKWGGMTISMLDSVVDMNNAHTVEYISFFAPNAKGAAAQLTFEIDDDYKTGLTLNRGADCAMSGVRVLMRGDKLRVAYARRKGEWVDKKKFDVTIYELIKTEGGLPGYPDVYFKEVAKKVTDKVYCDANMALDKESKLYQ